MAEIVENPITGIVKSLAEFQNACPAIKKDSKAGTGTYSYKYGSLPHVLEVIRPHLKKAGLCFSQPIVTREGVEYILTILYDVKTGEKLESKMELTKMEMKGMNIVQAKGSVITYLRRYALMSMLGIVAEDDDTDAAGQEVREQPATRATTQEAPKPWLNPTIKGMENVAWRKAVRFLAKDGTIEQIKTKYRISKANEEKLKNESLSFVEPEVIEVKPEQANMDFDNQGGQPFPDEPEDNPNNY
jgi:hypothetical protein